MKNYFYLAILTLHRPWRLVNNTDVDQTLIQAAAFSQSEHKDWRNSDETGRRRSLPAALSPQFTFTIWWKGKSFPCAVSLWELIRLTGPFSARRNATHSLESFHCSTEQQVLSARSIDFHSWCDSATTTSLLKKSPVLPWFLMCCVHVCECQCVLAYIQTCRRETDRP